MKIEITDHQREKGDEILDKYNLGSDIQVLKGAAGVGKTTLAEYIVNNLKGKTLVSAPTNKAVSVIKSKVSSTDNFSTIHSALKMKPRYLPNGKREFVPMPRKKEIVFDDLRNIIIDEGSMISTNIKDWVAEHARNVGARVLYIGDERQLNPVGELNTPIFHSGYDVSELTEIIRQGEGNPIIELSRNIDQVFSRIDKRNDVGGYIYNNDKSRVIDTLAEVNGTDELKYLAWTNSEVDDMNRLVRIAIYGSPARVELAEYLVFDAPYISTKGKILYTTNEEINVETLDIIEQIFDFPVESSFITGNKKIVKVSLAVYVINKGQKDNANGILVVHEKSDRDFNKIKFRLMNAAKARQLEFADKDAALGQFAQIKYNHALTIHKS